jgi:hypothetical protein
MAVASRETYSRRRAHGSHALAVAFERCAAIKKHSFSSREGGASHRLHVADMRDIRDEAEQGT